MTSKSVEFDGIEYVATKEAAKLTGYTSDYVGQLAREKKVHSKMVGRARFVDKKEVLAYKDGLSVAAKPVEQVRGTRSASESSKQFDVTQNKKDRNPVLTQGDRRVSPSPTLLYSEDDGPLMPELGTAAVKDVLRRSTSEQSKKEPVLDKRDHLLLDFFSLKSVLGALVVLVLLISTLFVYRGRDVHFTELSEGTRIVSHAAVYQGVPQFFSQVWKKIVLGAQIFAGQMHGVFVYAPKEEYRTTGETHVDERTKDTSAPKGLVVMPSTGSEETDALVREEVKEAFSDEVRVFPDEDGRSGIVRPVFRNREGQPFLYVIVPVEEQAGTR